MSETAILALVVAVTAGLALWLRQREGRARPSEGVLSPADRAAIGAQPDTALLLEFTAPACTPCAAARRVLETAAAGRSEVAVHLVDVGGHLDLTRNHRVLRAPTILVVDAGGAVRHRIVGVPRVEDLHALLDDLTLAPAPG